MKKIISLLLAVMLIASLCACGAQKADNNNSGDNADTAAIRAEFEKADAYIGSLIDADKEGMTTSVQDDSNGSSLYKYWDYNDSAKNTDVSMDIELDGDTLTVGKTTFPELKALGFDVNIDNETVDPNSVLGFSISKKGKFCNVSVDNSTQQKQKLSDMPVSGITCVSEDLGGIGFNYKGIKIGSSLKDIIDTLGVPNYHLQLSSDSAGTSITANYTSTVTENGLTVSDSLGFSLKYDAGSNNTSLSSIDLTRQVSPASEDAE